MSGWDWLPKTWKWHEWLMMGLVYAADMEGRNFQGDLVRGIAIGLSVATLIVMIAGRRTLGVLYAAFAIFVSFVMSYSPQRGSIAVMTHVMVAFVLLVPHVSRWIAARRAKSGPAPVTA